MTSISFNKIGTFFIFSLLISAGFLVSGCFRPESSLASREDDRSANLPGRASVEARNSSLDSRTEWSLLRYGAAVQKYSNRYDMDWRLVLAVMRRESRFVADATSDRGAFGLMQIMPATQAELANKLGVEETISPLNNIKAGVYHLQQLYRQIDASDEENHIKLTLAAYNAGLNRILDAQDVASYLGGDPNTWDAVKSALPLLSRRYQSLHRNIWSAGKPRAGYFTDWHQTIGYVESVMTYYNEYQVALN